MKGANEMSGFDNKADYENSVIELFQNIGYTQMYDLDL